MTFSESSEGTAIKNRSFKLYAILASFKVIEANPSSNGLEKLKATSQPLAPKTQVRRHGNPFSHYGSSCVC